MNNEHGEHEVPEWLVEALQSRVVYEGREIFGEIRVWVVDDMGDEI